MNLLIINQPHSNYGDLAAHRSLTRFLKSSFPESNLRVLSLEMNSENQEKMNVTDSEYISLSGHGARFTFLAKIIFLLKYFHFPLKILWPLFSLYPDIKKTIEYSKWADYIISAPGGISMGTFQNWEHILFLEIAKTFFLVMDSSDNFIDIFLDSFSNSVSLFSSWGEGLISIVCGLYNWEICSSFLLFNIFYIYIFSRL